MRRGIGKGAEALAQRAADNTGDGSALALLAVLLIVAGD